MNYEQRSAIEKKIVRKLIRVAKAAGFAIAYIDDGEERVKVAGEKEAMDLIFDLDEAGICFKGQEGRFAVLLVLGNDGYDVIADYSFREGGAFQAVMKEVDDYVEGLEAVAW